MPQVRRAAGFTLVELMVVVAIVGILAAAAVYAYTQWTKKARAAEVNKVFGEFALKQEQYYLENNDYLATGTGESDRFPSPTSSRPGSIQPLDAAWKNLRVNLGDNALWCSYVTIAGSAEDDTGIGALGSSFMDSPPATDWWYGIARCPFNGKTYGFRHDYDRVFEL